MVREMIAAILSQSEELLVYSKPQCNYKQICYIGGEKGLETLL